MRVGGTGGCDFAIAPSHTARDTTIFWAPEADTRVVLLAIAPSYLPTETAYTTISPPDKARPASDGLYLAHGQGRTAVYSVLLGRSQIDGPLVALVPLDTSAPERFAASERLWGAVEGRTAPDMRLTEQRRRRLRHMLRAVDGKATHASHREVAEAIFGRRRVEAELWHESSLRYATMRLVRDGTAMIDGGYRKLLRSRHGM
ncbi:DUF2285 domain-containing protein [Notoacmeibacter marinus]|uniref:DUF2285 domain-containing protein n=1 Tax=Notoacmeibacter marinus TaxID=1876515 RepID=UPI000DF31570|nr:DUF2285 domain-containing protein [Notoacmeibacter marinus]